ncbi:GPP34 family phosphoprotein [Kibdelosporangium lantanae]|uniref:GPP34 family phosphoprotein n=1 Tax=Kibdelosporangium lantanae TaxID=1497396 RepID=A0ABW3MDP6_9PSEU
MRLGDLSLSENLFFLGHDPFTGKPRVRQDILDIGLAGAALADLVLDERVALDNGVVVLRNRYATGDPLTDRVLTMIAREAGRHGGNGLVIVAKLAVEWGVRPAGLGKAVWARL